MNTQTKLPKARTVHLECLCNHYHGMELAKRLVWERLQVEYVNTYLKVYRFYLSYSEN